jgi:hypothetical protein
LKDDEQALNLYQRFKWSVVATLPRKRWMLSGLDVDRALKRIRKQDAGGST